MSLGKFLGKAAGIVGGAIGFAVGGPKVAAAGFAIGSAVGGAVAGSKAESAERKAARDQKRLAQLQAMRQRYEYLRGAQSAAAMARVANIASGAGLDSSTAQGVDASIRTTMRDDLGFQDQGGALANAIYNNQRKADSYRSAAAMGQAIGAIGSAAMSLVPQGGVTGANTSSLSSTDVQNFGTQAAIEGTTTSMPVYNTIDPYGGP